MLFGILKPIKELQGIYDVYKFDQSEEIGSGTFGTVHKCIESVSFSLWQLFSRFKVGFEATLD